MPNEEYFLFSDASFDPQSKVGVGAMLALTGQEWEQRTPESDFSIQTRVMASETVARLELMTALWALDSFKGQHGAIIHLFTDCKTIADLPQRRGKLEAGRYQSQRTKLTLANADLYRKFFEMCDRLHPRLVWLKGHSPSLTRNDFQRVFATVDKAARQRLRQLREKNR